MYDLVKLNGEGAQDPSQHDVVTLALIGECVDDVGEDVIIGAIVAECEGHEVTPLLVLGWEGL
jgi:hypothetical protein